jgi:hypothetical protein
MADLVGFSSPTPSQSTFDWSLETSKGELERPHAG